MRELVYIIDTYGFILEILLSNFIFVLFLKHRKSFILRLLTCIALLILLKGLFTVYPLSIKELSFLQYTFIFFLTTQSVYFCFETSYSMSFFLALGAFTTQHIAFRLSKLLQLLFQPFYFSGINGLIYILTSIIVYLVAFNLFSKILKNKELKFLENKEIMFICITLLMFATVFEAFSLNVDPSAYVIFALYDLLCCFYSLFIVNVMANKSNLKTDFMLMEQIWNMQKKQLELSRENMEMINIKCHDLKYQLSLYSQRLSEKEMSELTNLINFYDQSVKTGNEILDTILAEKSLFCSNNNIKLNCVVDGKAMSFMSGTDIYLLFSNAIDNALEAVMKIADVNKRIISLNIKESKGMVSVHLENYFLGSLNFSDDLPQTTKKDRKYHGYGMKSINYLSEKYNGTLSIRTEGEIFNLNILFQDVTVKSK